MRDFSIVEQFARFILPWQAMNVFYFMRSEFVTTNSDESAIAAAA
jgi:hypothetical protein